MKIVRATILIVFLAVTVIAVFSPSSSAKYVGKTDFTTTVYLAGSETFLEPGPVEPILLQPGYYYMEVWGGNRSDGESEKASGEFHCLEETTLYIHVGSAEAPDDIGTGEETASFVSTVSDDIRQAFIVSGGVSGTETERYPNTPRPAVPGGAVVITFLAA